MQRREFLQTSAAAGLAATLGTSLHADDSRPELSIERKADDQFVMDFVPREARPLRILQLTDTHFGSPKADAKRGDERSFQQIRQIVARERPDFLVHTGDFINNDGGSSVSFEAVDVLDDLGVPWTHVLGNHDRGHRPVGEFRKLMKHASVGQFDAKGGPYYAYRFDVARQGQAKPDFALFCFDSGFLRPFQRVSRPQLEWFQKQVEQDAEQGRAVPALAMIHIPVIEFERLRADNKHRGNYGERVCYDDDNGDTFAAFKKSGRIRGVFSGHDHKNDYSGTWNGIELVYGRVGGWSAYGELPRGGRLIEIDLASGSFSHKLVFPPA